MLKSVAECVELGINPLVLDKRAKITLIQAELSIIYPDPENFAVLGVLLEQLGFREGYRDSLSDNLKYVYLGFLHPKDLPLLEMVLNDMDIKYNLKAQSIFPVKEEKVFSLEEHDGREERPLTATQVMEQKEKLSHLLEDGRIPGELPTYSVFRWYAETGKVEEEQMGEDEVKAMLAADAAQAAKLQEEISHPWPQIHAALGKIVKSKLTWDDMTRSDYPIGVEDKDRRPDQLALDKLKGAVGRKSDPVDNTKDYHTFHYGPPPPAPELEHADPAVFIKAADDLKKFPLTQVKYREAEQKMLAEVEKIVATRKATPKFRVTVAKLGEDGKQIMDYEAAGFPVILLTDEFVSNANTGIVKPGLYEIFIEEVGEIGA